MTIVVTRLIVTISPSWLVQDGLVPHWLLVRILVEILLINKVVTSAEHYSNNN